MSETRFTPGPWGLRKAIEVWVMAGPIHVATVPRAYDGDWSPHNAHLIAAAPCMFEALAKAEQLADICTDWNLDEAEINEEMVSVYELRDEFNALLAKARGEQS